MAVINSIAAMADDLAAWRRHLHQNPELALDCHETAAFVVDKLRSFGISQIHQGIATSGIVAVIEGVGDGPCTGLRADMDALPMQEATGLPHASRIRGRMHACGHDGHIAMLLGAAKYLAETRRFRGRVALVFQPAEEVIGGARIMVEEGIMERFDIDEVYALHTDPFAPLGTFRTRPGPIMAATDIFSIAVLGRGGHAAYPHECIDPMPAALAIGQALQTIVSRNADPVDTLVVSLAQIAGGSATNIIPDRIEMQGTVRSFLPATRDMAEARLTALAQEIARAHGCLAEVTYQREYPATVNHAAQTDFAVAVAREVSGRAEDDLPPEMGAEDFSFMLEARPGCFLFLGQGLGPSVHHPAFDFNDAAAPIGASFFARLVETRQPLPA